MSVLKAAMAKKGYRQSDVAKAAAVSRQAVSLWFTAEGDFRNVHVANLLNLGAGLGVAPAELLQPLPGLADSVDERQLYAEFCWDRSYPDIYRFLVALIAGQPRAVARLIESRGIYEAATVLGDEVWGTYPDLRLRLPPARRAVVDAVWKIHHDLTRR
jgi:transcriptional regulator with XRE-family HTH domain